MGIIDPKDLVESTDEGKSFIGVAGKGKDAILEVLQDAATQGAQYWVRIGPISKASKIGEMRCRTILKDLVADDLAEAASMGQAKVYRLKPKKK
jgi:hypothetical protein